MVYVIDVFGDEVIEGCAGHFDGFLWRVLKAVHFSENGISYKLINENRLLLSFVLFLRLFLLY